MPTTLNHIPLLFELTVQLKSKRIIQLHGYKRRLFLLLPQLLLYYPLELMLQRKGRLVHLYLLILLPLQHLHLLILLLSHPGPPLLIDLLIEMDAIDILKIIILYLLPSFLFLFSYLNYFLSYCP